MKRNRRVGDPSRSGLEGVGLREPGACAELLAQDTCGSAFVLVAGAVAAVCLAACAAAIVASRPRVAAAQAAQGPLEAVAPLEECAALDADEDGSTAAAHTDEDPGGNTPRCSTSEARADSWSAGLAFQEIVYVTCCVPPRRATLGP